MEGEMSKLERKQWQEAGRLVRYWMDRVARGDPEPPGPHAIDTPPEWERFRESAEKTDENAEKRG